MGAVKSGQINGESVKDYHIKRGDLDGAGVKHIILIMTLLLIVN